MGNLVSLCHNAPKGFLFLVPYCLSKLFSSMPTKGTHK